MIRKIGKRVVSFALMSALAVGAYAAPFSTSFVKAETANVKVQLLGVNDFHGNIDSKFTADIDGDGTEETVGGAAYLAANMAKKAQENPNTLYVNAGDMFGATPLISSAFHDEPVVEIMEKMGYDVGTLGNHELDEGIAELKRMVNGGANADGTGDPNYDGMDFPEISANVWDTSLNDLVLKPYEVKEIGGQKIGFIGIDTTETPDIVVKKGNENLAVTDEVEAINKYTKILKDQGVKAIVVLGHIPIEQNKDGGEGTADYIASHVDDEVDIIFAGHNHQIVKREVDGKLIIEASEYGKAFSAVNLEIDPTTGDIVKKDGQIVLNYQKDVTPDADVQAIVDKYAEKVNVVKNQVAGTTDMVLEGGYGVRGPVGDNALGNMIADGMAWKMDAEMALMNGGGIRADVDAGDITFGDLFAVQPFGNTLAKVTLTGDQLKAVMDSQISQKYGPDFSISGFKYTYDHATNKVVSLELPDGTPVDPKEEYTVVVNNYMLDHAAYRIKEFAGDKVENGPTDIDATFEYVKAQTGPIEYYPESRIQEVSNTFKDVGYDQWANPFITDLFLKDIVKGTGDGIFYPNRELTRAQFASMLVRSLDLTAKGASPFADTKGLAKETQDEIAAAFENGLVKGSSPDKFEPNKSISRAQMVTMIMRAYEMKNGKYTAQGDVEFKDLGSYDAEMKNAILAAAELKIVQGYGDVFKPGSGATRAQGSKVLSLYNN
ncbi:5'-nucleotidase C-terminal domain-containing protein [Falsibacillus pallidus]|uniref:5'-nucleotidase C-terminal domain-containing protein n=1 Tax=Falsibacillus pallidus TaxID=493781 RepID=UPI003D98B165